MRALVVALVLASVLAGCSGSSDDSSSTASTTSTTHGHNDPTGPTTTTSSAPNVPPVLNLTARVGANVTTFAFAPANVTFDALGSYDPDADGLSAIAMTLRGSNHTYTAQLLYASGRFYNATYHVTDTGRVNVTASAVDRRNDITRVYSTFFMDSRTAVTSNRFTGSVPTQANPDPTTCKGPAGVAQLDAAVWQKLDFDVGNGTTFVTVKATSGAGTFAICDPTGHAVSAKSTTTATSNPGTVFAVPTGTARYFVSLISNAPNAAVGLAIEVHYEPQA